MTDLTEHLEPVQTAPTEHLVEQLVKWQHGHNTKLVEDLVEQHNEQALRAYLNSLHYADIADLLESLPVNERELIWDLLDQKIDGYVLSEVSDAARDTLVKTMSHDELIAAVQVLDADEFADLAPHLPSAVVHEAMSALSPDERAQVNSSMAYEEDTVGAVMDFELLTVRADVSCRVVLRYLRRFDELPKHTDKVFVIDKNNVLQGILPIRNLLVNKPKTLVADIMFTNVHVFHPHDSSESAAQAFERYDLVTAPVVDQDNHLLGRLTIDEMVDVMKEESEADIYSMAGLAEEDDLFSPVLTTFRKRWGWLAVNLCTALLASRVIGLFEGYISQLVALAALMPIIAGIGGNTGNQTTTMLVRAMAQQTFTGSQLRTLWFKEMSVAILNGVLWGSVLGLMAYAMYDDNVKLGVVMLLATMLNLMLAATMGVWIPALRQRMGRDPALGSSVMITACTDSGGFFIFLGLAVLILF